MLKYFKNLKSHLLIILAALGIGIIVAHPITPQLVSDCVLDQLNGTYDSSQTVDERWNACLLRPQLVSVGTTVVSTFLLGLWFRRHLLNGVPVAQVALISCLYGLLQFLSVMLLQSQYLYDAQQAITFWEIVRNYWFALDPILYYLLAVVVANLLFAKHDQQPIKSSTPALK